MVLNKKLCASLLAIALLSGCSLFGDEDVTKVAPLPKIDNQFQPNNAWSTSVGNGVGKFYSHLQPAYQNNIVYAADRDGLVKAIDVENGKTLWSVNLAENNGLFSSSTPALLSGGVAVDGHVVYIGSERAQLFALNSADGSEVWRAAVAGEVLSVPVVSDGVVLINTSNGLFQAIDQQTGTVNWTVNLEMPALTLRGESAPAVAHGAAIVGSSSGRVNAILLDRGQFIWQQRIAQPGGATEISRLGDVDITPVIVDSIVYAIAYNGSLAALDLRSGQIIWRREFGSVNNFIVDNNVIYLVDQDDQIMALDSQGGNVIWTQRDLLHRNLTAPVLYQGSLVVGDEEGYLHWLNPTDGQFVAQNKVSGSGLLSRPQVMADKLVIQAKNGTVYSYTR